MIVWRITGNEIGPNGNGAYYFATKKEAAEYIRDIDRSTEEGREYAASITRPEKLLILNREQLAEALNDAMGYGAS